MAGLSCVCASLPFGGAFVIGTTLQAPGLVKEPKVGFLAPKTGIFTQLGTDMQNGFEIYLNEHQEMLGGMLGRLIVEDAGLATHRLR